MRTKALFVILAFLVMIATPADAETVKHLGLEWTAAGKPLLYSQAQSYCDKLSLNGHSDWRLPNINELHSLYDPKSSETRKIIPGIILEHDISFKEMEAEKSYLMPDFYRVWSSTQQVREASIYGAFEWTPRQHLVFSFQEGKRGIEDVELSEKKSYTIETLCVRGSISKGSLIAHVASKFPNPSMGDLIVVASYGDIDLLRALWKQYPRSFKGYDWFEAESKINLLHAAAAAGLPEICRFWIEEIEQDVNASPIGLGSTRATALYYAVENQHVEIVSYLLNAGAKPNVRGGSYGTPLHAAAARGNIDLVSLLLDQGADAELLSGEETALDVAYENLKGSEEHIRDYGRDVDSTYADPENYRTIIKSLRVAQREKKIRAQRN